MKIILNAYVLIQNIIYKLFKLFKIDNNKILFLTRQSNNVTLDYKMLINEIKNNYSDKKVVLISKRIEKNLLDFFIKSFFINFKIMYHLATSKVVVIDGYNMLISILKHKKSLTVIQIWHSLGAIKKFGLASLNSKRSKLIANSLKMHKNYNYIITGSKKMIPFFMESFGYDESTFMPLGLPRIDYILKKEKKEEIYSKYKMFRNKKVIMYAPTFRETDNYKIEELINSIDTKKYILIFKAHEKMKTILNNKNNIYTCDDFSSIDLLSVTDYLITDYSAISIEAAVIDIPIYLYIYDFDEYSKNPGININLKKELPAFENPKELFNHIQNNNYDYKMLKEFKNNYVCNTNGTVTKNICDFIIERCENDEKN